MDSCGTAEYCLCCPLALTAQQSQLSPCGISLVNTGIDAHSGNMMLLFGGVTTLSGWRTMDGDRSTITLVPLHAARRHPHSHNRGSAFITANPPSTVCSVRALLIRCRRRCHSPNGKRIRVTANFPEDQQWVDHKRHQQHTAYQYGQQLGVAPKRCKTGGCQRG